jgi:hypothetical protein
MKVPAQAHLQDNNVLAYARPRTAHTDTHGHTHIRTDTPTHACERTKTHTVAQADVSLNSCGVNNVVGPADQILDE